MIRLTFRHDDGGAAASQWAARLRDATPSDVRVVAAFIDDTTLDIYLETNVDTNVNTAIDCMVAAFGLGECNVSVVVPVPFEPASALPAPVPTRQLTSVHRGEIVGVTVSPDGRKLSVNVRHRRYEIIDRIDAAETEDLVHLAVWVGTDADDPRADYATLADAFTSVTAELGQPVGTRRITYDS